MRRFCCLLWLTVVLLGGCGLFGGGKEAKQRQAIEAELAELNQKLPPFAPSVFRAVGYGAPAQQQGHVSAAQRDLLARRASTLDAYRSLAERVYGTRLSGNSSIQNLAAEDDRLRAYLDATIMGARVVAQNRIEHGVYETVVELVLDEGFRNCLATGIDGRVNTSCRYESVYGSSHLVAPQRSGGSGLVIEQNGLYFIE